MMIFEKKFYLSEIGEIEFPLSSCPYSATVRFVLSSDDTLPDSAMLRFHRDTDNAMFVHTMHRDGDAFSAVIPMSSLCAEGEEDGLFYYSYDLYFADGCQTYGGEEEHLIRIDEKGKRQLLVYRDDYSTPDWLRGAVMYHVFVDRFRASGRAVPKLGTILNPDWENGVPQYAEYAGGHLENNMFFGGDLWGIIEKLDYIASLGVNCLYLSPIFDAASNHKYDTGDYEHVDSMFGGDEAFDELIRAANARGIHVILDGVFNHTGSDSRYFNRKGQYPELGAYQSTDSPYYPWYSFSSYPNKYESWWGISTLPRVNGNEPSYRRYMFDENGVIAHWMHRGIAGWRLDVADELSDMFLDTLRETVRRYRSDGVLYGEVWENASNKVSYSSRRRYLRGAQLDSVMNYPLRDAIIAYLRWGDSNALRHCVNTVYRQYPKPSADILMNVLGTHDTERILTALGGELRTNQSGSTLAHLRMPAEDRAKAIRLLKIAYTLVHFMPGVPCIFYGDEIGMEGYGDPFCRRPFPWHNMDSDLLSFYRNIAEIRRTTPVLSNGYVRAKICTPDFSVLIRYNGTDRSAVLLLNRSASPISVRSEIPLYNINTLHTDTSATISPYSAQIFLAETTDGDIPIMYF